jgi:hypothetical protein
MHPEFTAALATGHRDDLRRVADAQRLVDQVKRAARSRLSTQRCDDSAQRDRVSSVQMPANEAQTRVQGHVVTG